MKNNDIKFDWKGLWLQKGKTSTNNLLILNGYEKTNCDPFFVTKQIQEILGVNQNSSILEVGCGAGLMAQFFDCKYVGIDYAKTLVQKIKSILKKEAHVAKANNLPFKNNSFDYVFAYSVFHYFPDKGYVNETIEEMTRVAKEAIFIGDLPTSSHNDNHLLFSMSDFCDWETSEGFYNKNRFNIYKRKETA